MTLKSNCIKARKPVQADDQVLKYAKVANFFQKKLKTNRKILAELDGKERYKCLQMIATLWYYQIVFRYYLLYKVYSIMSQININRV